MKKLAAAADNLIKNQVIKKKWQVNSQKIAKLKADVTSAEDDIKTNKDDIEDLEVKTDKTAFKLLFGDSLITLLDLFSISFKCF